MEHIYKSFGMYWKSDDLYLPELKIATSNNPDIFIEKSESKFWPEMNDNENEFLKIRENELRLKVDGVGSFRITNSKNIEWSPLNNMVPEEDIRIFLLGSAFGALLIQKGILLFHGNALQKDGKAIACLGHSGSGKSTLAYALMQEGWELLADDLVAITKDGYVLPGIQRIKLWRDSAEAFGLDTNSLLPIRKGVEKYSIDFKSQNEPRKNKLLTIYLIFNQEIEIKDKRIKTLNKEKVAAKRLINQVFRPRFVKGLKRESDNFIAISKLIKSVPVKILPKPAGIEMMQKWLSTINLLEN